MLLSFLTFRQDTGFGDRLPLDIMTKLFGRLAKDNPGSTVHDAPGSVALWWDRANRPGTLTVETAAGPQDQVVKPGEVIWLQNQTTLRATTEKGVVVTARILGNGEIKIEAPKKPRPRRSP